MLLYQTTQLQKHRLPRFNPNSTGLLMVATQQRMRSWPLTSLTILARTRPPWRATLNCLQRRFFLQSYCTKHFGERKLQAYLADLWMNVHNFCKIFKEEVEEIFRKEHLQKTWLHLGNGMLPCSYWLHDDSSSRSSLTKFIV